ncbi:MAG: M23 family metallopeptidase [Anaerolineae bacterium]
MLRLLLAVGFACALLIAPVDGRAAVVAQDAPCGVVDALDYPIDISDTLANRYDDFGLFRSRFGGRHTGLDVAFNRRGEPVYAAARGIVTYADPEGWDTEKGVVIIRHTFPDGGIYYTLYGHMEQSDDIQFPRVGACIERGDPVGVVGWPSRGLPHLHYEIRNFLPDDGGPGYVEDNPLLSGWYDPLDFTELWQIGLRRACERGQLHRRADHPPRDSERWQQCDRRGRRRRRIFGAGLAALARDRRRGRHRAGRAAG